MIAHLPTFSQQRSLLYSTLFVLSVHAALFFWLMFETAPKTFTHRPRKENLVIHTVSLKPTTPSTITSTPQMAPTTQPKTPAPASVTLSPPPPPPTPKPIAKKPPPKPAKPVPKKQPSQNVVAKKQLDTKIEAAKEKQKALLLKAQASMKKISATDDQAVLAAIPQLGKLPTSINSLQSDLIQFDNSAGLTAREMGYREELAGRLRLSLRLPEYGAVKIKLTLERNGKVAKLTVVSAESQANKKYIEKVVPTLTFPSFRDNFSKLSQYTFQITLNNDT